MSSKGNPSYEVQLRGWTTPEHFEGRLMPIYKRILCVMPESVTNAWHDEVESGRKESGKFRSPFNVNGKQFETSMSGIRAEKYTERLLNIALAMGEIDFYRKIGGSPAESLSSSPMETGASSSGFRGSQSSQSQGQQGGQSSGGSSGSQSQGSVFEQFAQSVKEAMGSSETFREEFERKVQEEVYGEKTEKYSVEKMPELPEQKAEEEKAEKEKVETEEENGHPEWYERALLYAKNRINVYLYGEAGTGKGYNSRKIACELNPETDEHDCFYQVNKVGDEYQLLGFNDAQGRYVATRFYEACKYAAENPEKSPLFMFDEMDVSSPDSLKCFNEAVASREMTFPNGEFVKFPNLIFFAAGNTLGNGSTEKYTANNIDKSTLDRYAIVETSYETRIELIIADGDRALVEFIDAFRKEIEKENLPVICSYRSLERLSKLKNSGLEWDILLKDCLLKGMASDDVRMVCENIKCHNKWATYLRKCAA